MKKITTLAAVLLASAMIFAGGNKESRNEEITVISREDGSGTRGAFIELLGVEQKDSSGKKVDYTTEAASISNSTSVVMTSVAQNSSAIGYISLGSLNSTVKALSIDGAEPTVANIKSGAYKIARPFNIATKGQVSEAAQDFIDYILSSEGQKVVESKGYIAVETKGSYKGTKPAGKIVVAGSSSVTPVMEKLKEEYLKLNTNAQIEVMLSDSTTGMNSAVEGICDIGMASRAVKSSELDKGLTATVIAIDGIAIIVNKASPVNALTSAQVRDIYMGKITTWSQIPN
ncbi:MAG TPA: substrate-binding domain-containing protein, partial [Treponemataceae bacterium]|nr:substrate-binding domain-containing protein [Treponemataceae bacterium]